MIDPTFQTGNVIIGKTGDSYYRSPMIDPSTHSFQVINNEHHETHAGSHYFIKSWADINGAATVLYLSITTPDTAKEAHMRALFNAEDEFRIELYEGATVSGGSAITPRNNNRNSDSTSTLTCLLAPTVSAGGTMIWDALVGAKASIGISDATNMEIIFKRNTTYVIKITKTLTGTHYLGYDIFWYEHTPKGV